MTSHPALILGGGSDIGLAIARRFAESDIPVQLAARRPQELEEDVCDIQLRYGVQVSAHRFDILDTAGHNEFLDALPVLPDIVICVVGLLGNQEENQRDMSIATKVMRSNYEGPAMILGLIANRFEGRGSGTLVGIASVAGDRGRATNYVYGSAKAGFATYLSGLRNRLSRKGIHVVTVKPGFVNTRMTKGMNTPKLLTAEPTEVADAVYKAVQRRKDVIYIRSIWRVIMALIGAIPESLFKKNANITTRQFAGSVNICCGKIPS